MDTSPLKRQRAVCDHDQTMKRRRIDQGPKIDFVDVLSEELILYVFAYLDASDLVKACQLVNRKWSRLSNDQSLWKRLYMETFHDPPAKLLRPSTLPSGRRLRSDRTFRRISGTLRSQSVVLSDHDWKRMFKIAHNWQAGTALTSSVSLPDSPLRSAPASPPATVDLVETPNGIEPVIQFSKHFLFAAYLPTLRACPAVQVWRIAGQHEPSAHSLAYIMSSSALDSQLADIGYRFQLYVTVIECLESDEQVQVMVGYSNGAFSIFNVDNDSSQETYYSYQTKSRPFKDPASVQAASICEDLVVSLNSNFNLSIYHMEKGDVFRITPLQQLRSFVCWNPVRLKVQQVQTFVDGEQTWHLTIAHATPIYQKGWSVSVQEIFLTKDKIITSRSASALPTMFHVIGSEATSPIPPSSSMTSLCLAPPHVLTAHKDNTIRLYHLSPSMLEQGQPSISYKATLYGHTGSVECLAADAGLGRFISGGSDGSVRIWELLETSNRRDYPNVIVQGVELEKGQKASVDVPVVKWVGFDEIRVVGIVRPRDISTDNIVKLWNFE